MATASAPKVSGYETTFITRAEMNDEQLKTLQEKLKEVIAQFKGEVVAFEDWGTKKLAYKIEKESRGRFSHFVYTGLGNVVSEMERNLRMNDFVMRFLSVNVAKEFNQEEYLKRKEAIKTQAKKREEEREARREERNAERKRAEVEESHDGFDDAEGSAE
jgi:small subunit ribosomal protein S6